MKVHINVQEVMYLEGVTQPYIQHDSDMVKTMQELTVPFITADDTTHIIVYVMEDLNISLSTIIINFHLYNFLYLSYTANP